MTEGLPGRANVLAGRYRVGEVLGTGGMGTVVRAHDEVLDRSVAIKFLRDDLAADAPAAQRFRREARIAASLSHPGIAQVYDFAEANGRPFIVMELLEGTDLQAVVGDGGTLEPPVAAGIVAGAAEALGWAHAHGAVHRDVKPANIVLTRAGAVKVTDFGVASAAQQVPLTDTGRMLGTSWYVSPEQAQGERAGAASDVYALGCVLYQLLAGRPPFQAESSVAVAMAHVCEPVPSAREANPAVPPELDAIARRAMAKDPAHRYPDGRAMAAALVAAGADPAAASLALAERPAAAPHPGPLEGVAGAGTTRLGPVTERLFETPPETLVETLPATLRRGTSVPLEAALAGPVQTAVAGAARDDARRAWEGGGGLPGHVEAELEPAAPPSGASGAPGRRRRLRRFALLAPLMAAAVVAGSLALMPRPAPPVVLPDWTGRKAQDASAEARTLHLDVRAARQSSLRPRDEVLAQEPAPRSSVPPGSPVTLSVSLGDQVQVPDVTGGTLDEARSVLSAVGLRAAVAEVRPVDNLPPALEQLRRLGLDFGVLENLVGPTEDVVVGQDQPSGAAVVRGSTVRLTIVRRLVADEQNREGDKKRNKNKEDD